MAGWKLRKDKTQTDTAQTETALAEMPGAGSQIATASPIAEFAAPPSEAEVELMPAPASSWELPAEDWLIPAGKSWDAPPPTEDEPVAAEDIAPEAVTETEEEAEEWEPQPAKIFDLSDVSLLHPDEHLLTFNTPVPAEAEALLEDEPLESENGLQFDEDEEPLFFMDDAANFEAVTAAPLMIEPDAEPLAAEALDSEPLTFTEPVLVPAAPESIPEVISTVPPAEEVVTEPEPMSVEEAIPPPAFSPLEAAQEVFAEPEPAFIEPEPIPEVISELPPAEEVIAAPLAASEVVIEPEPAFEVSTASPLVVEPAAEPPAAEAVDSTPLTFTEPEPTVAEPEPTPKVAPPMPATATPLFSTPPAAETDSFASSLRIDRSELAPSLVQPPLGTGVPTVAPFILDMPAPAVPAEETAHRLIMRFGRLSADFPLTKEVTVIGRPDSEMHYYPDIEIELDDAVSRRHAEVLRRGSEYYIADAGSTNGTLLNGESLPAHEERLLAHGDRIRVGERTEIIFE